MRSWHFCECGGDRLVSGDRHRTLPYFVEFSRKLIANTRSEILQMLQGTGFTVTQESTEIVPTYWTFVAQEV